MGVAHSLPGIGDGGAAAVDTGWSDVVISGMPDTDPSAVFDSLTVHSGGEYTPSFDDTAVTKGPRTGWSYIVDLPAGWNDDGSKMILMRIDAIDAAPSNTARGFQVGMVLADNAGVLTTNGVCVGVCLYYTSPTGAGWLAYTQTATTIQDYNGVACDWVEGVVQVSRTLATTANFGSNSGRDSNGRIGGYEINAGHITGTATKLLICGGYWYAGVVGTPVSARFRFRYKIVDVPTP